MAAFALDSPAETLTSVERAVRAKRGAEARILLAAVAWAEQHPGERLGRFAYTPRGAQRAIRIGGEGTPPVEEFCHAELAVSLEVHPLAARCLMADALDLRHRLPSLWDLVTTDLSLPEWVARKIARATRELTGRQIAEIDRRLAEIAASLPIARLLGVVEAMVLAASDEPADTERARDLAGRFVAISNARRPDGTRELPTIYGRLDQADALRLNDTLARLAKRLAEQGDEDPVDVRRSKALGLLANPAQAPDTLTGPGEDTNSTSTSDRHAAPLTLHLHLTERDLTRDEGGVARFEQGGPITLAHARELLGHSRVTIRPVLDPAHQLPADAYEFTGSLREAVLVRTPADCYPYAVKVHGTTQSAVDLDHTDAYDPHGPPQQTRAENAGPMTRHHHRIKTHGSMSVRQPAPGTYVWRTPHRRYLVTDHHGTRRIPRDLGDGLYHGTPLEQHLVTQIITAT